MYSYATNVPLHSDVYMKKVSQNPAVIYICLSLGNRNGALKQKSPVTGSDNTQGIYDS